LVWVEIEKWILVVVGFGGGSVDVVAILWLVGD